MSTVINNPGDSRDDNSGVGMILGILLVVVVGVLFVLYVMPMLRNQPASAPTTTEIKVSLPEVPAPAPDVAPAPAQ